MRRHIIAWLFVAAARTLLHAQAPASCAPAGGLHFICGIQNPEDLVPVPNSRWLFASGMADGSGLHLIDTSAKKVSTLYGGGKGSARADRTRFANCPAPLDSKLAHLHGLSLRPSTSGHYTLYATNHGGRESIEVFDVDAAAASPSATWIGCVLMPEKLPANSVAVFKDGTILATVLITPDRTFEDAFAGRITGVVYQWTPGAAGFKKLAGTELSANNGIETSADDRSFYVVSTTTKPAAAVIDAMAIVAKLAQAILKEIKKLPPTEVGNFFAALDGELDRLKRDHGIN